MKKLLACFLSVVVLAPPLVASGGPDELQLRDRQRLAAASQAQRAEQARLKACYEAHGHLMQTAPQSK